MRFGFWYALPVVAVVIAVAYLSDGMPGREQRPAPSSIEADLKTPDKNLNKAEAVDKATATNQESKSVVTGQQASNQQLEKSSAVKREGIVPETRNLVSVPVAGSYVQAAENSNN